MAKIVLASLMMVFALLLSAFAANPICSEYNEFVATQCVSPQNLKKDLDAEMLKTYSVKSCRDAAFKSILQYDLFASETCKPVMNGKLITSLKLE